MKKYTCIRLKELRIEKNLSLEQLSKLTGFSVNKLNKFEKGLCLPNLFEISILGYFLDARIDYVVGTSSVRKIPDDLPFGEYDNYIYEHEKYDIKK